MTDPIASRPTPWTDIVLLCGKCGRKLDGGYGPDGDQSLRTALRDELKATGRKRQLRVIETKCIGLCPKKSVTAILASRPGEILAIPAGTNAAEALARLSGGLGSS